MRRDIIIAILLLSALPATAHAYIDPGSGSALISIIIGAFVAAGVAIKTFWYKITGIFSRKSPPESPDESEE